MKHLLFCLSLMILARSGLASPIPGFGSSHISNLLKNIAVSEYGFKVGPVESKFWSLKSKSEDESREVFQFIPAEVISPARFTVNIDKFSRPTTFDSYVKKWIKEYPYLGFEILKNQSLKVDGEPGVMIDLVHRKMNKQMRQFVAYKKDYAVIMTCSDQIPQFQGTAQECADLVNHFKWTHSL